MDTVRIFSKSLKNKIVKKKFGSVPRANYSAVHNGYMIHIEYNI